MPSLSLRLSTVSAAAVVSAREIIYVLFIPSGSTRMLTSTGDVFKVKEA